MRRELPFEQERLDDRYAQEADVSLDGGKPGSAGETGPLLTFAPSLADGGSSLEADSRSGERTMTLSKAIRSPNLLLEMVQTHTTYIGSPRTIRLTKKPQPLLVFQQFFGDPEQMAF